MVVVVVTTTAGQAVALSRDRPCLCARVYNMCVGGNRLRCNTNTHTHAQKRARSGQVAPKVLVQGRSAAAAAAADYRVRVRVCIEQRDQSTRVTGIPPGHRDAAALRTGRRSPPPPTPLLVYNKLRSGHLRFQYTRTHRHIIIILLCDRVGALVAPLPADTFVII